MNTKIIKLDLNKSRLYEKIKAKQGDTESRFLLFQLFDGALPFSLKNRSVRAYMIKPDSKEVFNDLIINDRIKGYCTLELTNQVLAAPGTVKIELMITEGTKKLTSSVFELEVDKSINSEKSIVSTNEFTALLNGLASLSEYDNYKNELKDARDGEVNVGTNIRKIKSQLDKKVNKQNSIKYLNDFNRFDGEIDDTGRLQRAINSFSSNVGGTIVIDGDIYVSNEIICNKTGITLEGYGNRISRIITSYSGITLNVKPLRNGLPYTNLGYCKFNMKNIAICAVGDAIESGTGLYLQWVYGSSFINLYTSGFKKHIVFKGSHLNNFYNLYQANEDLETIEIFNNGVGISCDSEVDVAGESTSNNNHFYGGTLHNCSIDLRGMTETLISGVDIEPAGYTCYLGNSNIFENCRFERFDIYEIQGKSNYGKFSWFNVGKSNKIINCKYHQSGSHATKTTPILDIQGDNNYIEVDGNISHSYLIELNSTNHNKIVIKNPFIYHDDEHMRQVDIGGQYKGDNIIIYEINNNKYELNGSKMIVNKINKEGRFGNSLHNRSWATRNSSTSLPTNIPNGVKSIEVIKVTCSAIDGGLISNDGLFEVQANTQYYFSALINVESGDLNLIVNISSGNTIIEPTNGWKYIIIPFYSTKHEYIYPCFLTKKESAVFSIGCMAISTEPTIYGDLNIFPIEQPLKSVIKDSLSGIVPYECSYYELKIIDNDTKGYIQLAGDFLGHVPTVNVLAKNGLEYSMTNGNGTIALTTDVTNVSCFLQYK